MKHFLRIAAGETVLPVMQELVRKPHLWGANDFRQNFPNSALAQTSDILIRYPDVSDGDTYYTADRTPVWHPAAVELPALRGMVLRLMSAVGAYNLGRVFISKLNPGAVIIPHTDTGIKYTSQRDIVRYHLALQGLPGSLFRCGDETVQMLTGEVWWFAADVEHECMNNSADDRIHLVVDLNVWGRE